jgi:hypothetical protein
MGNPTSGGKSRAAPARTPQIAAPETRAGVAPDSNSDRAAGLACVCSDESTPFLAAAGFDSSTDDLSNDLAGPYLALTGGEMGPAGDDGPFPASMERLDAVNSGIANVIGAIGFVEQRRRDALSHLSEDTVPAMIPDTKADIAATMAVLALGAATAGIGGAIAACITEGIRDAVAKELLKSAVKDVIDDALNGRVRAAVTSALRRPGMADARQAFFREPLGPLEEANMLAGRDLQNPSRKRAMLRLEDPAGQLSQLANDIGAKGQMAYDQQYRAGLIQWLDLLAQTDLGSISGNTDMLNTYVNGGLASLLSLTPRGVLRLQVIGSSPRRDPIVTDARMAGANPQMLDELARETPDSAGLPVEVDAELIAHPDGVDTDGYAGIGMNESGPNGVFTDPAAEEWLALYATGGARPEGGATGGAGAGALRLLDRVVRHTSFAKLGVEVG